MLLAARDGEELPFKRSPGSESKAMLIPELFDALVNFGRELRTGEAELKAQGQEVATQDIDSLLADLVLKPEDAGEMPPVEHFLTAAAKKKLQTWRDNSQSMHNAFLKVAEKAKQKANEEEEKAAKRARKETLKKAAQEAELDAAAAAYDEAEAAAERLAAEKAARDERFQTIKRKLDRTVYWCDCRASGQGAFHAEKCKLWGARRQLRHPGLDFGLSREDLRWFTDQGDRFSFGSSYFLYSLLIACS